MRGKTFWTIIIILVIALGAYFIFSGDQITPDGDQPVDIENDFGSKIVYTTDMSVDTSALEADCELRGGEFNECGNICEPDAAVCAEVCAYTCEDISPEKGVIGGDEESTSTATSTETSTSSATSTN